MKFLLLTTMLIIFTPFIYASAEKLGYMGRLANSNGVAIAGPVTLKIDILTGATGSEVLRCTTTKTNVPLVNGVFNISIDYSTSCDTNTKKLTEVLTEAFTSGSPKDVWITITTTNTSPNVVYGPNPIYASPVSLHALSTAEQVITNTSLKGIATDCGANEIVVSNGSGGFVCSQTYANTTSSSFTGDITASGSISATAFLYTSDERKKKDITPFDSQEAIEKLKQMQGYRFNWKKNGKADIGFIAQEIQKVYPELVVKVKDSKGEEFLSVKYANIIAIYTEILKSQQNKLEKLEKEVELLKLQPKE